MYVMACVYITPTNKGLTYVVVLQGRSQDFPKGVLNSIDAFSTDKSSSPMTTFNYFR